MLLLGRCNNPSTEETNRDFVFYNHGDSAEYVGIQTCRVCHEDIYNTFMHTGMGESFDLASPEKSASDFTGHPIIYDSIGGYNYTPEWRGDTLYVIERKTGAAYFKPVEVPIQYIIGSGQHTNSHLFSVNGYIMQAPFTFYVQSGKWDLPPGFERGNNSRFTRKIGLECMSCHNAMPTKFKMGSDNRFGEVPLGINCERCHGPGSLHVAKIRRGIISDTANDYDPTIVNPKRLSSQAQVELCQRCHLQGNAVLHEGKSFFDFLPGMKLSSTMDVYVPRYDDSDQKFIMASHADRLKQSECFKSSNSLSCVSCHNPHVSVRETNITRFNSTCKSCHLDKNNDCSESLDKRLEKNDNCSGCHMPVSSSIDIPHVTVHDHKIQVPNPSVNSKAVHKFLGLVAVNNVNPTPRSRALAYIQQFEKFGGENWMLDSALNILKVLPENKTKWDLFVQASFLKGQYNQIVSLVQRLGWATLEAQFNVKSYENRDAYFWYRLSEAFGALNALQESRTALAKATDLAPLIPEFHNKFGSVSLKIGDLRSADMAFQTVRTLQPNMPEGWGNGGYVELFKGDTTLSIKYFNHALSLDPDYSPARRNLASLFISLGKLNDALAQLTILKENNPSDNRLNEVIEEVKRMMKTK